MNKKVNASNDQMKDTFELLSTIKKVEPSADLFSKIEQKVKDNNTNVVPIYWLKVAAVLFACFISLEVIYLSSNNNTNDEISQIYYSVDNTLYNE